MIFYLARNLAISLMSIMPETCLNYLSMLKIENWNWHDIEKFKGIEGHVISKPVKVHEPIKTSCVEKLKRTLIKGWIDFGRIQIKVVKIIKIKKVKLSRRLRIIGVDSKK